MYPIGVMLNNLERDRLRAWEVAVREGFQVVHTSALMESWLTGPERQKYIDAARASGLTIAAMFVGFDGQSYESIDSVARTVGLLPIPELREHRLQIALLYCDLAKELDVPALAMHLGFMPKDTSHADYVYLVQAVRKIADRCAKTRVVKVTPPSPPCEGGAGGVNDISLSLLLETGQESAQELLRFIQEVNRPNLGVNFDPANFILYNTDDPDHALEILGPYVRGVHCKDGTRPTAPGQLGKDVPLGTGEVDFLAMLNKLKQLAYTGPLIIEREAGPNVREEIRWGKEYLECILPGL